MGDSHVSGPFYSAGGFVGALTGGVTGDVTGDINGLGAVLAAEHGIGAIGTAFAPRTYRWNKDGTIITEIHVDLTGLLVKGDAAKDAIGLGGGSKPAYIGRYVVATYGVVYKVEIASLETPTASAGTITTDIDLGAEDVATSNYDDPIDDVVIDTGGLSVGQGGQNVSPGLTPNDYLYLVEGDAAASAGTYGAGQVVVRLIGKAVIT